MVTVIVPVNILEAAVMPVSKEGEQGDQFGRIFAYLNYLSLGNFIKFTQFAHIFGQYFSRKKLLLNWAKYGVGYT
jgi:hypothetical protein